MFVSIAHKENVSFISIHMETEPRKNFPLQTEAALSMLDLPMACGIRGIKEVQVY